ncbi:hypothetical protein AOZ06_14420 [Kibdelosporangium phytohabitans]|uniref:Uncharacterized protein n=1 Tax=Kibdelosporangium phytohabitans TaxID=860235 RepID=A0A0N9HXI5_9PSEU|nr:hypothetical protein AOZ06_14420 [Kibdelosporangium phytohabitans]
MDIVMASSRVAAAMNVTCVRGPSVMSAVAATTTSRPAMASIAGVKRSRVRIWLLLVEDRRCRVSES